MSDEYGDVSSVRGDMERGVGMARVSATLDGRRSLSRKSTAMRFDTPMPGIRCCRPRDLGSLEIHVVYIIKSTISTNMSQIEPSVGIPNPILLPQDVLVRFLNKQRNGFFTKTHMVDS